jgi:hypothetical protein
MNIKKKHFVAGLAIISTKSKVLQNKAVNIQTKFNIFAKYQPAVV